MGEAAYTDRGCSKRRRTHVHLALRHATVRHGTIAALDDVTLTLPAGTHLIVWGSAGCGKTTLLKALAGLIALDDGVLEWSENAHQGALGMVFQSDALFDSMTVAENVQLPLIKRGVPKPEAIERAQHTLARVGLGAAANRLPESLSGGMKKRCGLARAIVAKPLVLLADDPFAGLDPHTEQGVAELLLEVAQGRTLVVALPDPVPSLRIAQTCHLIEGRLEGSR